uniref:Uncharacterized protein n=1 Tax=Zooxanthella nutricula TaxID=1333877 RepID=A0A7S2KZJ8_9DINO
MAQGPGSARTVALACGRPLVPAAMATESRFDRHRFDNHTAWLDREGRRKAKAEGRSLGFGYAEPRAPPPAKQERPFYVLEPAFTSGLMVNRKYNMIESNYKSETERSDPHHYPNYLEVTDAQHFGDFRRRSQNVDPREWKPNPAFADIVTDDMVKQQLSAHLGEARKQYDPKMVATLFDDQVRPQAHTLKELNCDVSCLDLPTREGGPISGRVGASPTAAGRAPRGDWGWCMGGRKAPALDRPMDEAAKTLAKTQSLPQMALANQPSMLHGNLGGSAEATFHGVHTRKFGGGKLPEAPDLRMRGSTLAQTGWAGTFPAQNQSMYNGG